MVPVVVVAEEEVDHRRRSRSWGWHRREEPGGIERRRRWHGGCRRGQWWRREGRSRRRSSEVRRALVALGEEAEGVDLLHEVGYAGPAAEAEADHQHPRHHERVDHVRARPTPHQPRRRLHRVLHRATTQVKSKAY